MSPMTPADTRDIGERYRTRAREPDHPGPGQRRVPPDCPGPEENNRREGGRVHAPLTSMRRLQLAQPAESPFLSPFTTTTQ